MTEEGEPDIREELLQRIEEIVGRIVKY